MKMTPNQMKCPQKTHTTYALAGILVWIPIFPADERLVVGSGRQHMQLAFPQRGFCLSIPFLHTHAFHPRSLLITS
jgi:hypothetical protein